jgi:sugar phosphate isomerase/epimerase
VIRPGIFARTFVRPTLEAALDAVVAAGVRDLQFNLGLLGGASLPGEIAGETAATVRSAVEARGLTMAAVSGTYNMAHPDPALRDRGRRALAALIGRARDLGTGVVTVCTGTRDPADMWRAHPANGAPEAWRDMLASMAAAAEAAEAAGVTIGVEPEHANVVRDARAARRLLDELRSPNVGIVVDAANLVDPARAGEQERILQEAFALLGEDLVLAHAKDVRADGAVVAAGSGTVDYPLYVELLRTARYDGPLVLHGLAEEDVPAALAFLRARLVAPGATGR